MKGFGVNQLMKLITFSAGHVLIEPELYEGVTIDDWQTKLKSAIITAGNDDNKPLTFYVDEYKMIFE
jgi:hypothetical protein